MKSNRVQLFATCLVDTLAPEVGECVVEVLERAGVEVEVPEGQTCCGQPAFNGGFWDEARAMARHTIEVFGDSDLPVVIPSGSCGDMIVHHYPELFADDPAWRAAGRAASRAHLRAHPVPGGPARGDRPGRRAATAAHLPRLLPPAARYGGPPPARWRSSRTSRAPRWCRCRGSRSAAASAASSRSSTATSPRRMLERKLDNIVASGRPVRGGLRPELPAEHQRRPAPAQGRR